MDRRTDRKNCDSNTMCCITYRTVKKCAITDKELLFDTIFHGDMIEVFKILHHVYDSDVCEGILKLSDNKKTRGHSLKLHAQQSRLDIGKYSFAVRVVKPWNSLLEEVVTAPSVQAFEARRDKAWNDQPLKFQYKEDLVL